jgi:hypothetical protein
MAGFRIRRHENMYRNSKKKRIIASIIVIIVLVAMLVTGILSAALI